MNSQIFPLSVFLCGAIGLFVGLSELVNRYNSFGKIFKNVHSWIYMLINFAAGILVYVIIKIYKVNLGPISSHEVGICFVAGIGAMTFLRSSFFTYKTSGDQIIYVGPAAILAIFLKAAEFEFDRNISTNNLSEVSKIMKGLKFISASKDLPLMILATMRVLSNEEQKNLSDDILKLVNDPSASVDVKNIAMGCILIKYTGITLLTSAVRSLKDTYPKLDEDLEKITKLQSKLSGV